MGYRFRLVEFQLEYVLKQGTTRGIKAALENDLPKSLPDAYGKIMSQMTEGQKKRVFEILSWIFHARRRLKIDELCEALSVENGCEDLDELLMPPTDSIIKQCESLVELDKVSQELRFTHQTVNEYLKDYCASQMLSPVDMAKTCLIYLGFSEFDEPCGDQESFNKRIENYKFSGYAATFWGLHTKGAGESCMEVRKRFYTAFKSADREYSLRQIEEGTWYLQRKLGKSFFHVIAMHGLATICRMLLEESSKEIGRYSRMCFVTNKDFYTKMMLRKWMSINRMRMATQHCIRQYRMDLTKSSSYY